MTERTPTAEALEKAREIRHKLTKRGGLMQFLRIWPDPAPAFDALLALALEDFAAQAVNTERTVCADIAMGSTGPGNTMDQCQGYSDACRDIGRAIRARRG